LRVKQLLFLQTYLTGNGDTVCFYECGTEFINSLFIYTNLLPAAADRSIDAEHETELCVAAERRELPAL
jgi:hypothetical protein